MPEGTALKLIMHLAVDDVSRSVRFFERLGVEFDPRMTDEHWACMKVNEDAFVFLLPKTDTGFRRFTPKEICDSRTHTEVFTAFVVAERWQVDEMIERAFAAGATRACETVEVPPLKYGRSFQDPDGHVWEVIWMDASVWADTTGELSRAGFPTE